MPVDIIYPNGERATVPEGSVSAAISEGAKVDTHTPASTADDGGALGMGAAAILGAGSAATLGATDRLFREGSYVAGGKPFEKEVTTNLRDVRERNPGSTMVGELGGLLLNPAGIEGAGEMASEAVAARVGEGLLGKMAQSGARLAAESAVMGAQHQVTEDALGDHEYNGEAIFANAAKDALIGAPLGAGLGALGYAGRGLLSKSAGLLSRPGPMSHAALDEIAGAAGAGRGMREYASQAEARLEELQRSGLTSEQAQHVIEGVEQTAKARSFAIDADAGLRAEAEAQGLAIRPDGSTGYDMRQRRIPLSEIDVPPVWDPTKMPPLRAAREAGAELDPIRIGRMAEDERYGITDGIHRANLAAERGEKDILAKYEIETQPQRLSDATSDFTSRVDATDGPIDIGALRPPKPPVAPPAAIGAAAPRPSGPVSGLLDQAADRYAAEFEKGSAAQGRVIREHYADKVSRAVDAELAADARARRLADAGTKVMRLEDTLNQVNFTERPEQFARMLDPSKYGVARDALTMMGQDVRSLIGELDMLPTRTLIPSRIGKVLAEADLVMSHLPAEPNARALGEAWSANYRVKQAVGKASGFGKAAHLRTPEENAFGELYERMRLGFEDESAFGGAGKANKDWNASFTDQFGRRKDYGSRFSVSIDQGPGGTPLPELDAGKLKGFLGQMGGAEADQSVKSTEAMIDWERNRIAAIQKHAVLTVEQRAAIAEGNAAVDAFEKEFKTAMSDSEAENRLKQAVLEEKGNGMGGIPGLFTDAVTRPLKTIERLAQMRNTVKSVEGAVKKTMRGLFEGGEDAARTGMKVAEKTPRAKDKVIAEMQNIRELAGNPQALEAAATRMVGDLSNYAPKTANEVRLAAMRALLYLAREAPNATTTNTGTFGKVTPRYSDIQIHDWESKRDAAFDPRTVLADMKHGRLNRDAIQTAEVVAPKLFAMMQQTALDEIQRMDQRGELDNMPYQRKAAIATLLKIPVDRTWEPDFIALMQGALAKSANPAGAGPAPRRTAAPAMPPAWLQTEAQQIEGGL